MISTVKSGNKNESLTGVLYIWDILLSNMDFDGYNGVFQHVGPFHGKGNKIWVLIGGEGGCS